MNEFTKKLIERLEEERRKMEDKRLGYEYESPWRDCYYKTKAIVNQLAEEYNNDVCEWQKVNSNRYDCLAHAESHDSRVLDWCVCPYCGKKIKVVE